MGSYRRIKVAVIGAGGVVGQSLQRSKPSAVDATYFRSSPTFFYRGIDLSSYRQQSKLYHLLDEISPSVIINLAGQNQVDVVEKDPKAYRYINTYLPDTLGTWCIRNQARLIQGSTQGVFSGDNAPYYADNISHPITEYGKQKHGAEFMLLNNENGLDFHIARFTFVLGLRYEKIGRVNPIESMLSGKQNSQVCDRWFSPAFAFDIADLLWEFVIEPPQNQISHLGLPLTKSRYDIARDLGQKVSPVSHNDFPGIAPRPKDTTWGEGSLYGCTYDQGIERLRKEYEQHS